MGLKRNDPRARMYADAREVLGNAISFGTPEERRRRRQELVGLREALVVARDRQAEAAARAAQSEAQARRQYDRVTAMYEEELREIDEAINDESLAEDDD